MKTCSIPMRTFQPFPVWKKCNNSSSRCIQYKHAAFSVFFFNVETRNLTAQQRAHKRMEEKNVRQKRPHDPKPRTFFVVIVLFYFCVVVIICNLLHTFTQQQHVPWVWLLLLCALLQFRPLYAIFFFVFQRHRGLAGTACECVCAAATVERDYICVRKSNEKNLRLPDPGPLRVTKYTHAASKLHKHTKNTFRNRFKGQQCGVRLTIIIWQNMPTLRKCVAMSAFIQSAR